MRRTFPADPASLSEIRRFVREQALSASLGWEAAEELTLAVSEAAANAIRHTETPSVTLAALQDRDCVVVEVQDEGVFDSTLPVPELDGPSGRGILLMTAFVDEVAINEGTRNQPGTTVRLRKCREARLL
ncbi:MAG: ATP-binding protein [Actinomycetota bacterium]|nr:ATP-binding protein [Actinomycetota bacterium]